MTVLGAAVGAAYASLVQGTLSVGAVNGLTIAASVLGVELYVFQGGAGRGLRRLPLPLFIGITTVVWIALITLCLFAVPTLMQGHAYGPEYHQTTFAQDLSFALLVSFVFNAALRVRSLVGPRVLGNFLLGRYHRPLREERVFMFLDLADSTGLAERLGDLEAQSLIGRFFFDIAAPIARHRGETHRYIGDEVVVTWPLEAALRDSACLRCVSDIERTLAARAERYRHAYGTVPEFRVGMHGGAVVASEVGDDKRDIVYFGDTINTAARIASTAKRLRRKFLISDALSARLALPPGMTLEPLGPIELAGKRTPVALSAVSLRSGS